MPKRIVLSIGTKKGLFVAEAGTAFPQESGRIPEPRRTKDVNRVREQVLGA